jgi:2-aminoadipate transaminase
VETLLPDPGVVSFARGIPSPETFPTAQLIDSCRRALERHGSVALNYGPPEGFAPLREWIARQHGVDPERILVTPGSIMGMSFVVRAFAATSAGAAVEAPTYDRMLGLMRRERIAIVTVRRDADTIDLDELRALFRAPTRPAYLYVMPTFHNPTGRTMPRSQREELVELAIELDFTIVEDDPYGLLRIDGEPLPRLHELLRERGADHLGVLLSSFSKTVAPGMRIGYAVVPEQLVQPMRSLATAAYVTPPLLPQAVLHEFLVAGGFEDHLVGLRAFLRRRRDALLGVFSERMPADASWTRPGGGYFLWLELPSGQDAVTLAARARERGVAIVPGSGFFADSGGERAARLSFSYPSVEEVILGATRLADLVRN